MRITFPYLMLRLHLFTRFGCCHFLYNSFAHLIFLWQVAAQNCRKRKLDQILHLADEVKAIQNRKNELYNEYEYLSSERTRIKHKFSLLYRHIFQVSLYY